MALAEAAQGKKAKFHAGKYLVPGTITERGKSLILTFAYSKPLIEEIKAMEGCKWLGVDGGPKAWCIKASGRNLFQLEYLLGGDPYAHYDKPFDKYEFH